MFGFLIEEFGFELMDCTTGAMGWTALSSIITIKVLILKKATAFFAKENG